MVGCRDQSLWHEDRFSPSEGQQCLLRFRLNHTDAKNVNVSSGHPGYMSDSVSRGTDAVSGQRGSGWRARLVFLPSGASPYSGPSAEPRTSGPFGFLRDAMMTVALGRVAVKSI